MKAPTWVVVFNRSGLQDEIIECNSGVETEATIYHNIYYGRRCLKITVKAWR